VADDRVSTLALRRCWRSRRTHPYRRWLRRSRRRGDLGRRGAQGRTRTWICRKARSSPSEAARMDGRRSSGGRCRRPCARAGRLPVRRGWVEFMERE
jgi:hypothetical protein